jgi:hypothetical protein
VGHPALFADERLTAALLDRLTFKAHILEFIGESYRFRERMQREAQSQADCWAVESAALWTAHAAHRAWIIIHTAHRPGDDYLKWLPFRLINGPLFV